MKVIVFSERARQTTTGLHPVVERVCTVTSFAFDGESLDAALLHEPVDAVLVGYHSVPRFLEAEREAREVVPDSTKCVVTTMLEAEIVRDDAIRFGFAGALSIAGSVVEAQVRAQLETLGGSLSDRGRRLEVDVVRARHTFGVLYTDPTDFDIGRLVSMGMVDRDIAGLVHVAPQTVRNRISAILERSRLVNRTDLAMHHRDCAVRLWEEPSLGH